MIRQNIHDNLLDIHDYKSGLIIHDYKPGFIHVAEGAYQYRSLDITLHRLNHL